MGASFKFPSDGGGVAFTDITYSDAVSAANSNSLLHGSWYRIIDRPSFSARPAAVDNGIILQATSEGTLSKSGIRRMLVPYDYSIKTGQSGVAQVGMEVLANDTVIWGGMFWINDSGSTQTVAIDDDITISAGFTLIHKVGDPFSSIAYVEKEFEVVYDFENDWVEQQRDGSGNVVGMDFFSWQEIVGYSYNPCDCADWNYATSGRLFFNNKATTLMNNASGSIYNNSFSLDLKGNAFKDGIFENTGVSLANNVCSGICFQNKDLESVVGIPSSVVNFTFHTPTTFSFDLNFTSNPLMVGVPQFWECLPKQYTSIVHIVAISSSPINGGSLSIGVEVDDPHFLGGNSGEPVSSYNDSTGFATSIGVSAATTAQNRRMRIESFGSNITTGVLRVFVNHTR